MGALPNLVIIGAMKCGTTSLHEYLDVHPDIQMSNPKEINFFSGTRSSEPLEWYKQFFDGSMPVRGESSQNYSKAHHPMFTDAPKKMAEIIPNCKIIYIVRDPIERYLSHMVESQYGNPRELRIWNSKNDHFIKTGLYHWQLSQFLEFFSLSSVLVVDLHRLTRHRLQVMKEIFDFLGAKPIEDESVFDFVANASKSKAAPFSVRRNVVYRAAKQVMPQVTDAVIMSKPVRQMLFPALGRKQLSEADRAHLVDVFSPDVEKLRQLTNQEFAAWSI